MDSLAIDVGGLQRMHEHAARTCGKVDRREKWAPDAHQMDLNGESRVIGEPNDVLDVEPLPFGIDAIDYIEVDAVHPCPFERGGETLPVAPYSWQKRGVQLAVLKRGAPVR